MPASFRLLSCSCAPAPLWRWLRPGRAPHPSVFAAVLLRARRGPACETHRDGRAADRVPSVWRQEQQAPRGMDNVCPPGSFGSWFQNLALYTQKDLQKAPFSKNI